MGNVSVAGGHCLVSLGAGALPKGGGRAPAHRFASNADLGIQLFNLLQGEALGLVDEEPYERDTEETGGEPDEEDLGLQVGIALTVVDQVRCRVGDGPVEKPLVAVSTGTITWGSTAA